MARVRRLPTALATLVVAVTVVACAVGDSPPSPGVRADGFPTGVFVKTFEDPDLGPVRLSWIFDSDGDWAEVPEAMAGQTWPGGPARGHYTIDGDVLSITVDSPAFWADHQHRWRFAGERLITTFEHSDLPEDKAFFGMLDRQPWVRVP